MFSSSGVASGYQVYSGQNFAAGATLNETVTANNATTQYWFAYGTSKTALSSKTASPAPSREQRQPLWPVS